jgi:uncharacterized small protein (DUF1192 family)
MMEPAMEAEDLPKKKPEIVVGENLDMLSVADLEQRISILESEIARIRQAVGQKRASKTTADSFFRS